MLAFFLALDMLFYLFLVIFLSLTVGFVLFFGQLLGLFLTSAHFVLWLGLCNVLVIVAMPVRIIVMNGRNIAIIIGGSMVVVAMVVCSSPMVQIIVPGRRVVISTFMMVGIV